MANAIVRPDRIDDHVLRRLNRHAIADPIEVRRFLENVLRSKVELRRGTNRHARPERARLRLVGKDRLVLSTEDFDAVPHSQVFLSLGVSGSSYIFACDLLRQKAGELETTLPPVIYRTERRGRRRVRAAEAPRRTIELRMEGGLRVAACEVDESADGLGVEAEHPVYLGAGARLVVDIGGAVGPLHAEVRNLADAAPQGGWRRIGLLLTRGPRGSLPTLERREAVAPENRAARSRSPSGPRQSRTVEYRNAEGERIRAIVDFVGGSQSAAAVIIPPAWGRTKESTLALAETILQSFEEVGESVCVVRFDGVRKRGESHNDPGCLPPIGENRHYTFSQGVRDIHSTIDYLEQSSFAPSSIYLVTFSIASVEGRRAIAVDRSGRISGWISIVGAVDPQSMIKVVSGGVDYFAGALDGLEFGTQYIQGLLLDVDRATADAIASDMAFLDDARRDMATIDIPITWIYGSHDAWTQADRVKDAMSVGDTSRRRLIEVPTGHQMRASEEALDAFELVAVELGRMALERPISSVRPSKALLRARRQRERRRLRETREDLREFWRNYLVGRDGGLGIELVSATSSYRSLMAAQVAGLNLKNGARIVDLGAGAGALAVELIDSGRADSLRVVGVDLVVEGLGRARDRIRQMGYRGAAFDFVASNLDRGAQGGAVPLAGGCADAVLASLLLNYVVDPAFVVLEAARLLEPGGRFVASSMRPDADVSRICVSGVEELRSGAARAVWLPAELDRLDVPLQEFISNGARLLDLEEAGEFNFWNADEFAELIEGRFFRVLRTESGYGDPPQAVVVVAERVDADA